MAPILHPHPTTVGDTIQTAVRLRREVDLVIRRLQSLQSLQGRPTDARLLETLDSELEALRGDVRNGTRALVELLEQ